MLRACEQVALKTRDIDARIKLIGPTVRRYLEDDTERVSEISWIRDTVNAVHVYLNPDYSAGHVGDGFQVHLAFNYFLIPNKELELIQLVSGESVQLMNVNPDIGLSHLGYHIPNGMPIYGELQDWRSKGYRTAQVSMTTRHTGTSQRYLYAFVDTRLTLGVWTKVIQRIGGVDRLDELVARFEHAKI